MKEVSMRRCLRTAVLAGLVVWVWLVHVNGSQPIVPEKDIEMSLTFSSEPELGKQFAVTFIFTPREQILHASELDDVAEIHFDRGVELISGVPKWEGRLAKGKTETIQIVVKV
ncbi:MAG: hypothetical protein GTO24_22770, partial [candidate division Zixibacteria bacterium]|nr:hypothetical protein [candidate division Zixibacteria bacterium]